MLTQEYLKECFNYDHDTGILRWKVRPQEHFATDRVCKSVNSKWAGHVAGAISSSGYLIVGVNGKRHLVHRVIWPLVCGKWPEFDIDHINGNRADNRLTNLREATRSENRRNCRIRGDNKSGLKGVGFHKKRGKYRARIKADGITTNLGFFSTPQEAHTAYCTAADKHHGQFANHGDQS
jgi:hypothetical protein